jgi:tetratricopeptide (TPR) repeat protein
MNRMLILAVAALTATGCAQFRELTHRDENPYEKPPFYAKYLNTGSALDAEMQRVLDELRANPDSAELHNDLGAMLVEKGFPKDAAREFERAVDADGRYFPAWYNLGLVRAANGDELGARRALIKTVSLKPGHSAALFQLGLIEEKRFHTDRAVELYAKAYSINPKLLDVAINPRILDSNLTDLALLRMYKPEHTKESMQFQDAPVFAGVTMVPPPSTGGPASLPRTDAPSPQPAPRSIVTPSAPPTDPGAQTQPQTNNNGAQANRRRRPRNQALEQPQTPVQPEAPPQNPPV